MNSKLLSLGTLFVIIASSTAYAVDGTINFKGEIINGGCVVNSSDKNKEVVIGKYPTKAFTNEGDITASTFFSISVEKCNKGEYTVRFDGTTVSGHPNLLAITPTTDEKPAGGVGIEITTLDGKPVPINAPEGDPSYYIEIDEGKDSTFNFKAHYKSFQKDVSGGKADSIATFTIGYK